MDHPTFFSSGDSLPLHRNVGVEEHEVKETEPLGLGPWLFSDRTGPNLSNVPMGPVAGGPGRRGTVLQWYRIYSTIYTLLATSGGGCLFFQGKPG